MPRGEVAGSHDSFSWTFFEESPNWLHNGCVNFYCHQQWMSSFLSSSSPTLVVRFIDDDHSDWGEGVAQGRFNLHFPDGQWYWTLKTVIGPFVLLLLKSVLFSSCAYLLTALAPGYTISSILVNSGYQTPAEVWLWLLKVFSHAVGCLLFWSCHLLNRNLFMKSSLLIGWARSCKFGWVSTLVKTFLPNTVILKDISYVFFWMLQCFRF